MTERNDDKRIDADSSTSPDVHSKENTERATAPSAASYVADDGKKICVICLEDENEQFDSTRCNHSFHSECLKEWLRKKSTCPTCRSSIKDTGSNESSVSEHSAVESNDEDENHYMFETFLRIRSDNENFPTHLSFQEFLEILENEEGDGEMSELVARVEDASLDESSDSESFDWEHFGSGVAPVESTEYTTEDLYAIFTRIRSSSEHFPNDLTYEEFVGTLDGGSSQIWELLSLHL